LWQYHPEFNSAEEIHSILIERELFNENLTHRSVVSALEAASAKHNIERGMKNTRSQTIKMLTIAQYIDKDTTITYKIDIC